MKKTWALVVLIFSLLLSITLSTAKADSASEQSYIKIIVNTPTDKAYDTGSLTLNVSVYYFFASFNPNSVSYRIDEQNWRPLTVELNKSEFNTIIHGGYTGLDTLPTLGDGKHKLNVHVECQTGFPSRPHIEETTSYFSVDTASPKISNISLPNQAFNQPALSLNFTVNEPTSWIGYSLDNAANVTITGNATITPQTGSHSIVIYANDTAGNMGKSETINFTTLPNSSPETIIIAITISIITLATLLVAYFCRRSSRTDVRFGKWKQVIDTFCLLAVLAVTLYLPQL